MGRGRGVGKREKVQEISSINGKYKIGKVKNSIGNGEAKELVCTTHGHELKGGMQVGAVCRMEWSEVGEVGQL